MTFFAPPTHRHSQPPEAAIVTARPPPSSTAGERRPSGLLLSSGSSPPESQRRTDAGRPSSPVVTTFPGARYVSRWIARHLDPTVHIHCASTVNRRASSPPSDRAVDDPTVICTPAWSNSQQIRRQRHACSSGPHQSRRRGQHSTWQRLIGSVLCFCSFLIHNL